jgi:uncharacterized protein (DUF1330 family)
MECSPDYMGMNYSSTDSFSALNKEAFLTGVKEEFLNMKKEKQFKLADAIQKRKEIQNYITQVLQALNSFGQELLAHEEENSKILSSLVAEFNADQEQDECSSIQPYMSVVNNLLEKSNSDSNIYSLAEQLKMHYANELNDDNLEENLVAAAAKVADIDKEKKAQIKVAIYDESNIYQRAFISKNPFCQQPLPMGGEDLANPFRQNAILLSHVAYSIKKRKEILERQSMTMMLQSQVPALNFHSNLSPSQGEDHQQQNVVLHNPELAFVLGQSHFYLPLWRKASGRTLGEIRIRSPKSSPFADFIKKLGDATFKAPAYLFSMTIGKVLNPN